MSVPVSDAVSVPVSGAEPVSGAVCQCLCLVLCHFLVLSLCLVLCVSADNAGMAPAAHHSEGTQGALLWSGFNVHCLPVQCENGRTTSGLHAKLTEQGARMGS